MRVSHYTIALRRFLSVALAAATLAIVLAASGYAQDYPTRPVRLIVAFAPGGATDFTARLLADRMQGSLGKAIIIENKPGANGAIAAEYVAKSDPDGYTLFFTTVGAVAINPALRSDLPYDPLKDFAAVGKAAVNSTMLVVNARHAGQLGARACGPRAQKARRDHVGVTGRGAISDLGRQFLRTRPASSCRGCRITARRRRSPTFLPAASTACSATCRR